MNIQKKIPIILVVILFIVPSSLSAISPMKDDDELSYSLETIQIKQSFDEVTFDIYDDGLVVRVDECNFNMMRPGHPVIPSLVLMYELPFGSQLQSFEYSHSSVQEISIPGVIRYDEGAQIDSIVHQYPRYKPAFSQSNVYPESWVSYHVGGGLSGYEHMTFLVVRLYPTRYNPVNNSIHFVNTINVTITYHQPDESIIPDKNIYDLLIITPHEFANALKPLVNHKQSMGVKTKLVDLDELYERVFWQGRDNAEKMKYFIKTAIEEWGISHVLLVGGRYHQFDDWYLPIRYSHVVPPDEQEYAEESFLADLYFADIYDSTGDFSSWDSNDDDKFAVWNESYQEAMDLYPDVYLGRLACRNIQEVKTMVKKIITYEETPADESWFRNLVLVAGDSYVNVGDDFNEGEIIAEKAITLMPGFTPLKVYASIDDINRKTVNYAMNQGAGFAFFCGHGSSVSWSTHFPPAIDDRSNWTTGYKVEDMIFLKNKEKLPITVVGGCHNGQYDMTIINNIIEGIKTSGMRYFLGRFFFDGWTPKCWAWWLTSTADGGAIATIANTGLGTHGEEDSDHNGIIDYLEVLDGWMELRFLELYGLERQDDLGLNHGQTITEYLHRFLGDTEKMDTKMVQQWQLFGDPSLKIGGYQ